MQLCKDVGTIKNWVKERQTIEQKMLSKLNALFKEPEPTDKMRRLVLAAFETMIDEVSQNKVGPTQGAIETECDLAVWVKTNNVPLPHGEGLPQWMRRLYAMYELLGTRWYDGFQEVDCDDFSELIRVVGAWLEKGGGFGGYQDINKALRVGVSAVPSDSSEDYNKWKQETLKKKPELKNLPEVILKQMYRDDLQWGKSVRQREDTKEAPDKKSFHHPIEPHVRPYWVRPKENRESGMQLFRANRDDLCKRIDLLFGLLTGATLSGTTTDTVMVLETFGQQLGPGKQLHAGYYLFPAATIAASLHHTLLEVALSLTLDGCIESYCVGFYSTLKPKDGLPHELSEAEGILQKAETDLGNHHLVIWYDGKDGENPTGCIRFDKKHELQSYRRLVEARGLLTHVMKVPKVPTQSDVAQFIQLMAPNLLAYLPQEFQPRRVA